MTMNLVPEGSDCLGTRPIEIKNDEKESKSGLLATFIGNSKVWLLVSDGTLCFGGSLVATDIKLRWKEDCGGDGLLEQLGSYFLGKEEEKEEKEEETISVTYHHVEEGGIKVVMRQRFTTGVVRLLWTSQLAKEKEGSCFEFMCLLGNSMEDLKARHIEVEKERASMEEDLWQWKDTAGKLEGGWQKEKDVLLAQFLTLYSTVHKQLRQAHKQLERLELRVPATDTQAARKKQPVHVVDHPDDLDVLQFGKDVVERLASGPKKTTTSDMTRNRTHKSATDNLNSSADSEQLASGKSKNTKKRCEQPTEEDVSTENRSTSLGKQPALKKRRISQTDAAGMLDPAILSDDNDVRKLSHRSQQPPSPSPLRASKPPPKNAPTARKKKATDKGMELTTKNKPNRQDDLLARMEDALMREDPTPQERKNGSSGSSIETKTTKKKSPKESSPDKDLLMQMDAALMDDW